MIKWFLEFISRFTNFIIGIQNAILTIGKGIEMQYFLQFNEKPLEQLLKEIHSTYNYHP